MKYRSEARRYQRGPVQSLTPLFWCLTFFVIIVSVFGAAEVQWGVRAFAICAAATIFVPATIYYGGMSRWRDMPTAVRAAVVLFTTYCFLQIVPLPPQLWTMLPGQEVRLLVLGQAGLANAWMPLSLTPVPTLYGALLLFSMVIALTTMVGLNSREYFLLAALLVGIIVLGIFIGSVQVATAGRTFRFYTETDAGALVGLYANKNHMALAIVCSVVLAFFLLTSLNRKDGRGRTVFVAYWLFAALTLPMTNSRAGLILGVFASLVIAWSMVGAVVETRKKLAALGLLAATAIVIALVPLPEELAGRFGDVAADIRWPMLQHSLFVWKDYWVLGSGLGSFADVFMTYETPAWIFETYVNNVHNDYVQLGIETGVVGLLSVAMFGAGIVQASIRACQSGNAQAGSLALMGIIVLLAFALHSYVDYPLRRPAALIIFVFASAAVLRSCLVTGSYQISSARLGPKATD